jgi:hypothetical protein
MAGNSTKAALGGVLILTAADAAFNAYGALNSSPWTVENVAGDKAKAQTSVKYVYIAGAVNTGIGILASLITGELWPLIGTTIIVIFMTMVYANARKNGVAKQASWWDSDDG